jgi:hypothetical protein
MPGKMARSDPRPSVRITRATGSGQHLASVLQEGRESANIDAGLGFIWRISAKLSDRKLNPLPPSQRLGDSSVELRSRLNQPFFGIRPPNFGATSKVLASPWGHLASFYLFQSPNQKIDVNRHPSTCSGLGKMNQLISVPGLMIGRGVARMARCTAASKSARSAVWRPSSRTFPSSTAFISVATSLATPADASAPSLNSPGRSSDGSRAQSCQIGLQSNSSLARISQPSYGR